MIKINFISFKINYFRILFPNHILILLLHSQTIATFSVCLKKKKLPYRSEV